MRKNPNSIFDHQSEGCKPVEMNAALSCDAA